MKKTNIFIMLVLMAAVVFTGCDTGTTSATRVTDALAAAIVTATATSDAATVGTEVGEYLQANKTTLTAAIAAAQAVVDDLNTTQADIDAAVVTLEAAVAAFTASVIVPDYQGDVEALIVVAQALHDATAEGTAIGEAAVGSKATLAAAITAATALTDATAADVTTLVDAYVAFDTAIVSYGINSEAAATGIDAGTSADFGNWSDDGSWTGVMPVVSEPADTANVYEGTESWSITYDGTGIGGGGFVYFSDTLDEEAKTGTDLSAYTTLVFAAQTDAPFFIKIESGDANTELPSTDYTPVTVGEWDIYTISLADFAAVDFAAVTVPVGFWNPDGWEAYYTGVVTFDNVVYR